MTNAVPARPDRMIKIGDKTFKCVLNLTAFCALEEYVEKTTGNSNILTQINWETPNLREATLILWASTLAHQPDTSLQWIKDTLGLEGLSQLQPDIRLLLNDASPEPEKLQEGEELVKEKKAEQITTESTG